MEIRKDTWQSPSLMCGLSIGTQRLTGEGELLENVSPNDATPTARLTMATVDQAAAAGESAARAFEWWRSVPAPHRGELIRHFGNVLRENLGPLAEIVSLEAGKISPEAVGEVQEMIDICDFAVGLSRQLYGLTIATERPGHRMMEQWHPLGPVCVISAFNFPVAVWAWNFTLAVVCGNPVVWKPSEKTPLCALASHDLFLQAVERFGDSRAADLNSVVIGGRDVGQALAANPAYPLVSATGSVPMGRSVAQTVAARLGRSLLELGGNNAGIVCPTADLKLAVRGIVFSAVGTCGQRCTTLRRLFVHEDQAEKLLAALRSAYETLPVGHPSHDGTLIGPLIDAASGDAMQAALEQARAEGGRVFGGERITEGVPQGGVYVRPALVEMPSHSDVMMQETFAPILYVLRYNDLAEAIRLQNSVPQGLSSCIFTNDVREAEMFLSAAGSDCGIANVNLGPSGAEIGGAFGGEKETGGGRESGSDSWKAYMRRATNTINYSTELPLAQGIRFE